MFMYKNACNVLSTSRYKRISQNRAPSNSTISALQVYSVNSQKTTPPQNKQMRMRLTKAQRRALIFITFSIGVVLLAKYTIFNSSGKSGVEPETTYSGETPEWEQRLNKDTKLILLYTTWFDRKVWRLFTGKQLHSHFEECPAQKNCLATYDRRRLQRADGLVFHGRDVERKSQGYYGAKLLKDLRQRVPKHQKWIFLSHENPRPDIGLYKPYNGVFNWTATFSRRSNIFIPYSKHVKHEKPQKSERRNYAKGKLGLVAWAASKCYHMRTEYVLELQQYLNVTVYGKCRSFFDNQRNCKHWDPACTKELSSYKFNLAFENAFCQDYVTEKYWERIEEGVVPVVMGGNYEGLVIPGSYIDVSEFNSIKDLADYLLYLDANDDKYNEYFKWKETYKVGFNSFYCDICEKLHSKDSKKPSQVVLSKAYSKKGSCGLYNWKHKKISLQVQNSQRAHGWRLVAKVRFYWGMLYNLLF